MSGANRSARRFISYVSNFSARHKRILVAGSATLFATVPAAAWATSLPSTSGVSPVSLDNYQAQFTSPEPVNNVQVTVNGQAIEVPQNGTVEKTISDEDASTQVSVTAHNSSSSDGAGSSSQQSRVQIQSHTSSILNTEQTDN